MNSWTTQFHGRRKYFSLEAVWILPGVFALGWLLFASIPAQSMTHGTSLGKDLYEPFRVHSAGRVVAIGDLHGDADAMRNSLRLAGAIDDRDQWIGKDLVVVQTGDQIDRWHDDREILDFMTHLAVKAKAAGGQVISLLGNHELLNVQGDFRYVTPEAFAKFLNFPVPSGKHPPHVELSEGDEKGIEGVVVHPDDPGVANRFFAFSPGDEYARLLAKRPLFVIVDDTVFVHGGILPEHVRYGLPKMNQEVVDWMLGDSDKHPRAVDSNNGPVWDRTYSAGKPSKVECLLLESQVLSYLGVKRMVVGHTIQWRGINSVCGGKVWRIDVGLSRGYQDEGQPELTEILEIARGNDPAQDDRVRTIRKQFPQKPFPQKLFHQKHR